MKESIIRFLNVIMSLVSMLATIGALSFLVSLGGEFLLPIGVILFVIFLAYINGKHSENEDNKIE